MKRFWEYISLLLEKQGTIGESRERKSSARQGAHIFIVRRRTLVLCGALVCACAIFAAVQYPAAVTTYAAQRQLPNYSVARDQKVCSISFDAAWGADLTGEILDILDRYDVKTTFFVVGNWASQYPETVKAIAERGHEVMNHSNAHDHYNSLSREEIIADVTACNEVIAELTGVTPTLIRCPFGEYDDPVVTAIRSMGMEVVQWSLDSIDWKNISADEICRRIVGKVSPGEIILFHNAAEHTPEALPTVLEHLLSEGYEVVPISKILLSGEYTLDHTGRQMPAEKE